MTSTIHVILNPAAGTEDREDLEERVATLFHKQGLDATISLCPSGGDIGKLVKQVVDSGCDTVVAGGGDGTINTVAAALAGSDIRLGVLPLGTLNHFAKDLAIPLDLEEAIGVIAGGKVATVDVGEVNDTIFINNSSLGLYPRIVEYREHQQERLGRGKWMAFVWAAMTVLRRYPYLNVHITVDGKEIVRRTPIIFIGNNEYRMEGFDIGTREKLDRGHLSIYLVRRTGRFGLIMMAIRGLFGRLRELDEFEEHHVENAKIDISGHRVRVATDGEVRKMDPPLHYQIRPRALQVIVPDAGEPADASP